MPSILGLGAPELILILLLVIVIFGAGRIADIGGSLGRSIREFRTAVKEDPTSSEQERDKKA